MSNETGYTASPFVKALEEAINCHSVENESNTPDFILAQFLRGCLVSWNMAVQQRENWYGRDPRPSCAAASIDPAVAPDAEPAA